MEKLPEEIIQHIQSFMNGKEAARSTLLSKSWFSAWFSRPRPNLSFDQFKFGLEDFNAFSKFTTNIMRRYEVSDLKIRSFCLRITEAWNGNLGTCTSHSLAKELIVRAIQLGATDVEIKTRFSSPFVLPDEVLESQTLARLSVSGFTVDLQRRVACSNLKSLTLHHMVVHGDLFMDLISRCPLIEYLSLDYSFFSRVDDYLWCNLLPSLLKDIHICAPLLHCQKWLTTASWLSWFGKLVETLRIYRVSFTIDVKASSNGDGDGYIYVGDGLPRPVLETLTLTGGEVNPSFLDSLFLICRPKMIIREYIYGYHHPINEEMIELEGNVKLLEERFSKWRARPWMKLLDDYSIYREWRVARLQLRWNLANFAALI